MLKYLYNIGVRNIPWIEIEKKNEKMASLFRNTYDTLIWNYCIILFLGLTKDYDQTIFSKLY